MSASETTNSGPGVPSRGIPDRNVDNRFQAPSTALAKTLRDGRRVCLRAPCAGDLDQVKECFERLSPDSRHLRFFIAKRVLTDAELDFFTLADGQDHIAVAALELGVDGREARIHGMARCIREQKDSSRGELAVAVADDVQGLGVGRLLIEQLGRAARTQGIERFVIETLTDNVGMRALAERLGGAVLSRDVGCVHYELPTALAGAPETPAPAPAAGDTPCRAMHAWDIPLPWHWASEADNPFGLGHSIVEIVWQWTWGTWRGGFAEEES
nr:GNAT family N-acetyltransferase [Gammaproteobacteria bacterium]